MKQNYRYPGTRSFQKEDADIFFGREEDVRQLLRLIRLEKLVILHGKSGLGKTSLLNAGLLPLLESPPSTPADDEPDEKQPSTEAREIRFGAYQAGMTDLPLDVWKQQIQAGAPMHPLIAQWAGGPDSLWYYFKSKQLSDRDDRTTLLVFDQFEELFTYPEPEIGRFKKEFSDLLNGHVPDAFQKNMIARLREDRKAVSREDKRWLNKPLNVKVIVSIRSDRLSLLDQFTDQMPNMLVNLYELKPLNRDQARSAIVLPAAKKASAFLTAPFSYDGQAIETMLDALSNEQEEIESFQLQLLCQYLENQVLENPDLKTIRTEHFGGREGVQTILNNYYEREIGKLPTEEQTTARRFIEEGLIINEKRVAVAAGSEQARFGVSEHLLQQLLDSRLIRAGNIHLGKIYELSHDTLVEPVLKSYEKRKAEEARLEAEREIARQKEQLRREKKRRQRARLYAILGFTLFLLALIAGLLAWRNAKVAKQQEIQAKATALAAKAWDVYRSDHTLAFRIAESALKLDAGNQEVKNTILNIVNAPKTSFYQKVIAGHRFHIEDIVYSPNGKYFATACYDSDIRIWDQNGDLIQQFIGKQSGDHFPGHRAAVTGLSFSPDNRYLVSVGEDQMIKIWDIAGDSLYKEFRGHEKNIRAIDFSHQDNWFVTGGIDFKAEVWTTEGTNLSTMRGHQDAITAVSISPDDRHILSGSIDGKIILWDRSGRISNTFQNDGGAVLCLSFFPDGKHFVVGNSNKTADIWTIDGTKVRSLGGHQGQITDLAVSPDGSFILTASDDATAKLWSTEGEEFLTLTGHKDRLQAIALSPDGKKILTGDFDREVKMWDVALNLSTQRNRHTDHILCIDISDDNPKILTGSKDNTAKLWDFTGEMITNFKGHQSIVQSAFFVPGRSEILTASFDGTARVWNYDGQELLYLDHKEPIFSARATPDRQHIITGGWSGKISIWDSNGKQIRQWYADSTASVISIDLNPANNMIASAQRNSVKFWTLEGVLLDSLVNENAGKIYQVFFSRDGQSVYTAAQEFPIRKWSISGEPEQVFLGHFDVVYWLAEHPTQPLLASASFDKTIKIWNDKGEVIRDFSDDNGLYSLAYSKDGQYLITGGHDNIARIRDTDGQLVNALGATINIDRISGAEEVAPLSNIAFSMSELDIPVEYSEILYGSDPQLYINEGNKFVKAAMEKRSSLSEGLRLFDEAIMWLERARLLSQGDTATRVDPYLANAYKEKGEMLLIHRQFQRALDCFSTGLTYEQLDYLIILRALALLFNDEFDQAEQLVEQYKGKPVQQIYYYDNFEEGFIGELDYFSSQFNLTHADTERFLALFEQ